MKKNYTERGMRWKSKTIYVDEETGEQLTKHNATNNYIYMSIDKHVSFNDNKTCGFIEYTKKFRKNPQIKLF